MNLKYFILSFFVVLVTFSCEVNNQKAENKNDDLYAKNLATAKKFFELFKTEDTEAQKPLICPGVTHYPPFYGSEPVKYDGFISGNKAWMDNFDDITYDARVWLPGTDSLGVKNGSVRTYGTWSAKSMANGKTIKVRAYHYFDFNGAGQIHEIGDFFDASGVMNAAMASSEK